MYGYIFTMVHSLGPLPFSHSSSDGSICFVACRRPCAMCTQTCGPICLQACHQKKREVSYLKCILSLQLHVCLWFISFNFFDDSFLGVIHYHVTLRSGTRTEIATLKWKNFLPSCTPVSRRKIWQ